MNVMIVDDEPVILVGIQFMIEKYCPECRVCALAVDGKDGLQKIREHRPDIVITDITMPEMDGLELIRTARAEGVTARFVILSGYSDFNYARQAVSIGVEDYITKPIEEKELAEVMRKVSTSIARERDAAERAAYRGEKLREYVLRDVLTGKNAGKQERTGKLAAIHFPLSQALYLCLCLPTGDGRDQKETRKETLRALAEEYMPFQQECAVLTDLQDVDCVLMAIGRDTPERTVYNRLGMFRYVCMEKMDRDIWIGCSRIHESPEDIPTAFEEARCALNYRILLGEPDIIHYEKIHNIEPKNAVLPEETLRQLEEAVDTMDDASCQRLLDQIFAEWKSRSDMTLEQVRIAALNILLTGIRKIPSVQFQLNEYLGKNLFTLEGLNQFESLEQLKNWILNVLKSMNEMMLHSAAGENPDLIEESKKYIRQHFTEEISLKEVADRFFINASYFSTLFKKKTGMNYQSYVTKLRVDLAKKLLAEPEMRIYEICETVGYTDMKHFNRVFERETGLRPADYRKQIQENG